jgi:hypothetical protein
MRRGSCLTRTRRGLQLERGTEAGRAECGGPARPGRCRHALARGSGPALKAPPRAPAPARARARPLAGAGGTRGEAGAAPGSRRLPAPLQGPGGGSGLPRRRPATGRFGPPPGPGQTGPGPGPATASGIGSSAADSDAGTGRGSCRRRGCRRQTGLGREVSCRGRLGSSIIKTASRSLPLNVRRLRRPVGVQFKFKLAPTVHATCAAPRWPSPGPSEASPA